MKLVVIVMLAVLTAASSVTAASDTLSIQSFRVVNTCSGEKRWLISASIGEVFTSDSLMSFDITFGYNPNIIRPTDGLWTNTLAEKMKFASISPYINLTVQGEVRVGAFTISTPVKGNLPLFAIAGDFVGTCDSADIFTLPWEPEFNPEFKSVVAQFKSDTILAVAIAQNDPTQGVASETDTVNLTGKDSTGVVPVQVIAQLDAGQTAVMELAVTSPLTITIDSVAMDTNAVVDSVSIDIDKQSARVHLSGIKSASTIGTVFIRSLTDDTTATWITAKLAMQGSCLCRIPQLKDSTIVVNEKKPTVNVNPDVHADAGMTVTLQNGAILIQNHHGQPGTVNLVDVLGRTFGSYTLSGLNPQLLTVEQLPRGIYYIIVVSQGGYNVKKIEL